MFWAIPLMMQALSNVNKPKSAPTNWLSQDMANLGGQDVAQPTQPAQASAPQQQPSSGQGMNLLQKGLGWLQSDKNSKKNIKDGSGSINNFMDQMKPLAKAKYAAKRRGY